MQPRPRLWPCSINLYRPESPRRPNFVAGQNRFVSRCIIHPAKAGSERCPQTLHVSLTSSATWVPFIASVLACETARKLRQQPNQPLPSSVVRDMAEQRAVRDPVRGLRPADGRPRAAGEGRRATSSPQEPNWATACMSTWMPILRSMRLLLHSE